MKRPRFAQQRLVWLQTSEGWRAVRAVVPPRTRSVRSERLPRPPSFRFTAAGAEDAPSVVDELRGLAELRGVAELALDIVGTLSKRIGPEPTMLVVGYLLTRKRKR